nr:hypothetical protein [Caldimonas sp.]
MRGPVRVLVAALVVVGRAFAAAAADDPLHAPECERALAALRSVEESASAPLGQGARSVAPAAASGARAAPAVDPRLAAARRDVARHCLAARDDPPRAGRLAVPPVAVPPVAAARVPPPAAAAPRATTPPARIAPVQPPVAITSCDTGGCWTSERLQRLGPTLFGPRGACSVVGAIVHCP